MPELVAPIEAWVNWNPDPKVHAFGTFWPVSPSQSRRNRVLALCRITVREHVGEFDPESAKSCEVCAEFVRAGLTFEQASVVVNDRVKARMDDPNTIVCRRACE